MSDKTPLLWHTTPLHYLPYLLKTGTLLSAERLAAEQHPIYPRPTAITRKIKLGLANFVHLSLEAKTPLLTDKFQKGYPHALIAFARPTVLALPGTALLKYNTKRWAHRDDFLPVTAPEEKEAILAAHATGRYPSLEVLVPTRLPLSLAVALYFAQAAEAELFRPLIAALPLIAPPLIIAPERFPRIDTSVYHAPLAEYLEACRRLSTVLPPPRLPFD